MYHLTYLTKKTGNPKDLPRMPNFPADICGSQVPNVRELYSKLRENVTEMVIIDGLEGIELEADKDANRYWADPGVSRFKAIAAQHPLYLHGLQATGLVWQIGKPLIIIAEPEIPKEVRRFLPMYGTVLQKGVPDEELFRICREKLEKKS